MSLKNKFLGLLKYIFDSSTVQFLLLGSLVITSVEILMRNIGSVEIARTIGLVDLSILRVPRYVWTLMVCSVVPIFTLISLTFVSWNSGLVIKRFKTLFILLISFSVSACTLWFDISSEISIQAEYARFIDRDLKIDVLISSQPKERHSAYIVEVTSLQDRGLNFRISTPRIPKRVINEVCTLSGTLEYPENFDDFDYVSFLWSKRVYFDVKNPILNCYDRKLDIKGFLVDVKSNIVKYLEHLMPEPQVSLLAGIIFGEDRVFSEEFEGALRNSGTTHIVAASGYNVTVIVITVTKLLSFLGRKWRIVFSILAVWGFAIMSGLSASILRAAIMGSVSLIALILGRKINIGYLLLLSVYIFLLFNPRIIFDVGFQLSLAATLGLVYLSRPLQKLFEKVFSGRILTFLSEYLVTTLAATISTLPISLYTFGVFSIVSPVVNMLVLPILESTLLFGVLGLLVASLTRFRVVLYVVWFQLKYFELVVIWFGSLEWAVINAENFLIWYLIAFYIALSAISLYFYDDDSSYYLVRHEI